MVALDATDTGTAWPYWSKGARPKCAASLSGIYNFADRTPGPGLPHVSDEFFKGVETYTQTGDLTIQQAKSPVSLVNRRISIHLCRSL